MSIRTLGIALGMIASPPASYAQELPTTQLEDHGRTVLHGATTRSMLKANRGNPRRGRDTRAIARAKCAAAHRQASVGKGDPVLLRMCARAGY